MELLVAWAQRIGLLSHRRLLAASRREAAQLADVVTAPTLLPLAEPASAAPVSEDSCLDPAWIRQACAEFYQLRQELRRYIPSAHKALKPQKGPGPASP